MVVKNHLHPSSDVNKSRVGHTCPFCGGYNRVVPCCGPQQGIWFCAMGHNWEPGSVLLTTTGNLIPALGPERNFRPYLQTREEIP